MRTTRVLAVAAALTILTATPAWAGGHDGGHDGFDNANSDGPKATYLVELNPGADRGAEVGRLNGRGARVEREYSHALNGVAVQLTAEQAAALSADPDVMRIEKDGEVHAYDTQNGATWGIDRTDQRALPLSTTYSYSTSASNVTAYIIDTGILATHTEFGGRVAAGYDVITPGGTATDCYGHGTHVAGTVGGSTYGMAKGITLVPIRVLDCGGSGSWSQVAAGLDWAVAQHVAGTPAVANLSLGGGISSIVDDAINRLIADGVTVVVAAGNNGSDLFNSHSACDYSPAHVADAITVGATTNTDARASFSNIGTCLDLFAPGVNVTSAWYTSTTATNTISGTSMASPHVAGAAALYLADHPLASPAEVATALIAASTSNAVTDAGAGSPNRLLFVDSGVVPPPPAPPTITGLSPASGPIGTSVTITGTGLTGVTAVSFAGTAATTFSNGTGANVTATVPTGAQTGSVIVTAAGGSATWSGPFTVTTATAPAAPTGVTATSTWPGRATVKWTPTANNGGSALTGQTLVAYRVSTGARTTYAVSASATSVTVTNLSRRTAYQFAVIATNTVGSSPESAKSASVTIR